MSNPDSQPVVPNFKEALRFWGRIGFISFGGPAAQIAMMHRMLVEEKRWMGERLFLQALNFCMLLPGPEAQQLATYLGWKLHGIKGGILAGSLFILPSVLILFFLSWIYVLGGNLPWIQALFYGLNAAVIALVLQAILRIGKKTLKSPTLWILAVGSFSCMHFLELSFFYMVLGALLLGFMGSGFAPTQFLVQNRESAENQKTEDLKKQEPIGERVSPLSQVSGKRQARILLISLLLWGSPILGLGIWLGSESVPVQQALFFSKTAIITFGGAYAILPYVAQQAVENFGWITHGQMMSGLALAETTPGPLIMVLQFVGFLTGWQNPGTLDPLLAATIGALVTTWVTFIPCFLFVFLGAPFVEQLDSKPRLSAAMTAMSAVVVGVMINLAVQFADHALWMRALEGEIKLLDWKIAFLSLVAFLALQKFKWGVMPVIGGCGLMGVFFRFFFS